MTKALRYSCLALALTLGLGSPLAAAASTKEAKLIKRATRLMEQHKYSQAVLPLIDANTAAEGRSPEALDLLARCYLEFANFPAAIAAAHALVGVTEGSDRQAAAYELLGTAWFQSSLAAASEESQQAILVESLLFGNMQSVGHQRYMDRALQLYQLPRGELLEPARLAFEKAIELRGTNSLHLRYQLAETLTSLERFDEAAAVLEELFALAGDSDLSRGPRELQCYLKVTMDLQGQTAGLADDALVRPDVVRVKKMRPGKEAMIRSVGGVEFLVAVVDERGTATCIRPLRGRPLGITDLAIKSLQGSKIEPARLNGTPVAAGYHVIMTTLGSS